MHGRNRSVRHFSLHRIANTELRVVSDAEGGVIPFVEVEEGVLGEYARNRLWSHRVVTLFVLQDLEPLMRQLSKAAALPPGALAGFEHRPMLNVYDTANPEACHIFVNQQAMTKEGYWGDREAARGLLAHEHAHPLAECDTTRSSRMLKIELSCHSISSLSPSQARSKEWEKRIHQLLTVVADKLFIYAPREIFANDMAMQSGFTDSLFHLDRLNVLRAAEGIRSRGTLLQQLEGEEDLTPTGADLLLAIGDLRGHLDLAMETASFCRQDKTEEARELDNILSSDVMPHLEPEVAQAYERLRDKYVSFPTDLSPRELVRFTGSLTEVLVAALRQKGLELKCEITVDEG